MKFNFRKIGSVMASVAMLGSTVGIPAAAAYPGAFTGGGADGVAIVTGTNAGASDLTDPIFLKLNFIFYNLLKNHISFFDILWISAFFKRFYLFIVFVQRKFTAL